MSRPRKKDRTNTISLVILVVGFAVLAYYAITSLTARDPLWFTGQFEGQISRIVVYHAGQRTKLAPEQADFDELADAVQTSLAEGFARLTSLGLSEESQQDAYTKYVTLEVFFERPVELHTWFVTGRTTQMLFLITGRHSEMSVVFLGDEGRYRSGAPVLETMEPIREAVQSLGFY
jgi:hypothetical protein